MRPKSRVSLAVLLAMIPAVTGCFSYVRTEVDAVPAGEGVRIFLSAEELRQLESEGLVDDLSLGSPVVAGTLARHADGRIFLRVPVGSRRVGFHTEALDQELPIRTGGIVQVERRVFNRLGTGLLAAAGAGLIGSVAYLILDGARRPTEVQYPDPDNVRVPLLSIPFP